MKSRIMINVTTLVVLVLFTSSGHSKFNGDGLKNTALGIGTAIGIGAAISNGVFGEKLTDVCSTGYGAWACPMAAMAFVQAFQDVDGAKDMNGFAGDVGYDPNAFNFDNGFDTTNTSNEGSIDANGSKFQSQLANRIQNLKDKGYNVDPKTGKVTTPKGEYSAGQFASAQSMADAGIIGQDQVGEVDAKLKSIQAQAYKVVKANYGGGAGGGGGRSIASTSYDSGLGDMSGLFGMLNKKKDIKAVKTAGLVKNMNGTPVGVATDNIFQMINRRYQNHSRAEGFKE